MEDHGMTNDPRLQVIRNRVEDLAAAEGEAAALLDLALKRPLAPANAIASLQRLRPMVGANLERLASYLEDCGDAAPRAAEIGQPPTSPHDEPLSEMLRRLCLVFQNCALGYAMAYELALRLYEPRLREMAPKHLKAHSDAALSIAQLLPEVVAWQLDRVGIHCECICPMCSLGACGCVEYGTQTLTDAWRGPVRADAGLPGFVLQPPRPESQLAQAGVRGGDRLLTVDGQGVSAFDEVQSAVRKHGLGEEVALRIQRGTQTAREITVHHVSDYLNR
jgi:hypothetical protein